MTNLRRAISFFFFRFSFKFLFWISPWFSFGPYEWRWPIHLRNPLVCGVQKKSFERPCANWTSKTRGLGQGAGGPVVNFLESWEEVLDVCGVARYLINSATFRSIGSDKRAHRPWPILHFIVYDWVRSKVASGLVYFF